MRASIRHGDDPSKTISTADVIALEPGKLVVPIREPISVEQSIVLGFRQEMLNIGPGSVCASGPDSEPTSSSSTGVKATTAAAP